MSVEVDRLKSRFKNLFDTEGLTNVKFFVRKNKSMTVKDFVREQNAIEDTMSEGEFQVVDAVDADAKRRRFDDPY